MVFGVIGFCLRLAVAENLCSLLGKFIDEKENIKAYEFIPISES
jgi:hypothetical protein